MSLKSSDLFNLRGPGGATGQLTNEIIHLWFKLCLKRFHSKHNGKLLTLRPHVFFISPLMHIYPLLIINTILLGTLHYKRNKMMTDYPWQNFLATQRKEQEVGMDNYHTVYWYILGSWMDISNEINCKQCWQTPQKGLLMFI